MTPKEVLAMCREKDVKAVDFRFMDFPGLWQHFTIPAGGLDEDTFEDGLGFDGSSIRGWQAINEIGHARRAAARYGVPRPVHGTPDARDDLQHPRPDHPRRLQPRPAQRRPQDGQLSAKHGHRRHGVHWPGGGVFHFRRRPFRSAVEFRLLSHRQHRRGMEPRQRHQGRRRRAEPRLQAAAQGRLFPRAAGRPHDGHPQ